MSGECKACGSVDCLCRNVPKGSGGEEKTYYIGSYQRYCRKVKDLGLNTQFHVFVVSPERLFGLPKDIEIIDLGPPEVLSRFHRELVVRGMKIQEGL